MTKKKIVIPLILASILVMSVIAFYILRNINEKPPVVVEQTAVTIENQRGTAAPVQENTVISTSMFKGVDNIHWGQGTVEVIQTANGPTLSFGDDFEAAQGPDLFVYLSPNAADQALGEFASLGPLKAPRGAQQYTLPDNYVSYKTVVIWCRAFSATFATAELS